MDIKVEIIPIQSLLHYLEHKFSQKYSSCLFSLNSKIYSFYRSLDQLHLLFSSIQNHLPTPHLLLNNCLTLTSQLLQSQPTCIALDFCVDFLDTINQHLNHL